MDTAPDPLDQLWTAEHRAAARESYRQEGYKAADAMLADVPTHLRTASNREVWREKVASDWERTYDEYLDRARQIITAPEASGRETLARQLILSTKHSPAAARIILRDAGADVATLPVGGARKARLASIRLAASAPGGL